MSIEHAGGAVPKVANHAHCRQCGKAIPPSEKICSAECANEVEEEQKRRKKHMLVLYGLMLLGIVLLFVGPMFGG